VSDGSSTLPDPISKAARHQHLIVLTALASVTALGLWLTLRSGDLLMGPSFAGGVAYTLVLFIMWWTMMLAMMLPSVAPAILTYAAMNRKLSQEDTGIGKLVRFVAGYGAVWTGFSALAVGLQISVQNFVPMTGMMAVTNAALGGALLVAAGLYQLTPLKYACLRKCQSPLLFFAKAWRNGPLRLGLSHGIYCLGCCWVLMGLLFYGGVMELRWIVGLAFYVAAEKLIPAASRLSQFTGLLLVGWGAWELALAVS
jgi:predicted metal-binding membrane protein